MVDTITLSNNLGVSEPLFLRKLRRKADWGDATTLLELRLSEVTPLVFPPNSSPHSIFLVQTDEEFRQVILGLNSGRASLTSDLDFIVVLPRELESAGISARRTPGTTRCRPANSLHFDIVGTGDQLTDICRNLLVENRGIVHLTKGKIRGLVEKAREIGCLVIEDSTSCRLIQCA